MYGNDHDDTIRTAVRSSKTVEDACDLGSLKDGLQVFQDLLKDEKKAATQEAQSIAEEEPQGDKEDEVSHGPKQAHVEVMKNLNINVETIDEKEKETVVSEEASVKRLVDANLTFVTMPNTEKKVKTQKIDPFKICKIHK